MKKLNKYIIYKDNLIHNAKLIRKKVGKKVKICAMVKANAYGHGVKNVCKILKPYIDFFGVATVSEAKEIRTFDKDTPILVVGLTPHNYYKWCAKNNVSVTIGSSLDVLYINKHELELAGLKVHFKINTGLNRIGFNFISDFTDSYNIIKENKNIIIEGIFTHFSTKAKDQDFISYQYDIFQNFLKNISTKGLIVHATNSYATNSIKSYHSDMVRCGFNLYGWDKVEGYKPVFKIVSQILDIHTVYDNETVGYDRNYKVKNQTRVAVVSLGYADGFDRRLSNKGTVLIGDKYCKVIGNVCMDVFMVDIGLDGPEKVGDEVLIIGGEDECLLTPQYYATLLDTSPYEILLKFNHRRMQDIVL